METPYRLDVNQIQKYIPHRTPFLLVDRILDIFFVGDVDEPPPSAGIGTRVVGLKNITFNEPYFQGHFPGFAIVPGVLLIEMMAQTASFSTYPSMVKDLDRLTKEFQCILVGIDSARFRKPVTPGDTLRLETEVIKRRGKLWVFRASATVEGQKVAEAEFLANLMTQPRSEL